VAGCAGCSCTDIEVDMAAIVLGTLQLEAGVMGQAAPISGATCMGPGSEWVGGGADV
jgi:hypothetical protein